VGYAPSVTPITLHASDELNPVLTPTELRLPDVEVTAARRPLAAFETPLPLSSPNTETLRREHSISLAHRIDGLPGVRSLTTGGQIGKPVIRAFAGSRVLVLQDGMRLEDYSWSDEDGPSVDADLADRVEVIRGPASLLYGSDAIGGVVNVLPAPLPEAASGSADHGSGIEVYGASNAREFGTFLTLQGARGGFGWRGKFLGRFSGDMHTPDSALSNTGYGAATAQGAVGWHGDWGTTTVRYDHYGGEFKLLEATGPPPGLEGADRGPERKLSDDRVQAMATIPHGKFRFEPKVQWQRHWLSELADAAEVGGSGFTETTIFDLLLTTLSTDLLVHTDVNDRLRTTLGFSGIFQNNDSRAEPPGLPFVPDASINTEAGFGIGQLQVGRVSILGGGRVDHRSLSSDANAELQLEDQDIDDTAGSGNLGAAVRLTHAAVASVNVGRAWRGPNLFELFANGPLLAEGRYVVGSDSLDPETSLNVDGGFRLQTPMVRAEIAGYRNSIDHYISLTPTAQFVPKPGDPSDSLQVFRYESVDALLYGYELGAEVSPVRHLALRGRVDWVRGQDEDNDENLPLMPPLRVDLGAELHSDDFHGLGRSYFSVGVEINDEQKHLHPLDYPTDGYTLLNFGGGIQPTWWGRGFRIDAQVKNAANTEYKSFLSRYKSFAPNPGIDFTFRVGTDF
jgi:iron complex outermembrane recepter protein